MKNSESVADAITKVAKSITPLNGSGTDDAGGHVASLTEATMGICAGLHAIAMAIDRFSEAIQLDDDEIL